MKIVRSAIVENGTAKCRIDRIDVHRSIQMPFHITFYKKLAISDDLIWNALMRPVNDFFEQLPVKHADSLTAFYRDVWFLLAGTPRAEHRDIRRHISRRLQQLNHEIHLVRQLLDFVEQRFKLHSADPTPLELCVYRSTVTHEKDAIGLLAIAILCKMLMPIWGELSFLTYDDPSPRLCDFGFVKIIAPLLSSPDFFLVDAKLRLYVDKITMRIFHVLLTDAQKEMATHNLGDLSNFVIHTHATLLIKRYVNFDLTKPDANIVAWTKAYIKQVLYGKIKTPLSEESISPPVRSLRLSSLT